MQNLEQKINKSISEKIISSMSRHITLSLLAGSFLSCSSDPIAGATEEQTDIQNGVYLEVYPEVYQERGIEQSTSCYPDNDKDSFPIKGGVPFFMEEAGPCLPEYAVPREYNGKIVFDCDDANLLIYPGAKEECNGADDNCDGKIDEALTQTCYSACGDGLETCINGVWKNCSAPKPSTELCDNKDNDCNGKTDEGLYQACTTLCGSGTEECVNGKWINCSAPLPQIEVCDNKDNNCDGKIDENLAVVCYSQCGEGKVVCSKGRWGDCNADKNCCTPGSITDEVACPYDPQAFLFIIDNSGSMSSSDPNMLRYSGAVAFVDQIEDEEKSGLIVYSDNAEMIGHITSNKELVKSYLSEAMANISGGSTNIPAAMLLGIDELKSVSEKRVIILLTDGQSNVGNFSPNDLKNNAQSKDIRIYTMGLGPDVNSSQLSELATSDGGYYFVTSASDIPSIYNNILNTTKNEAWKECDNNGSWVQKYGVCY